MAPGHGFEPRFTASKAAVLPLDEPGTFEKWCGRWESNPQDTGSEPASYANSPTPAWWRGKGSNLRCLPHGSPLYRRLPSPLGLPLQSGRNGGGRTHTGQALNLFPLPSWDTFRWWAMRDSNLHYTAFETVVSACWTNGPYSVVLAEESGVEPLRPKSSVFGTGGLASYAQLLRARSITQAQ